jgi:hypothetical protein
MKMNKKYSFIDILEKEVCINEKGEKLIISKIEIPMIQRDYAQGRSRDDEKAVRGKFLTSIFEALEKGEKITLDFIYGSLIEETEFIVLDGQQRLTTLFLLYWYIASRESIEDRANVMHLLSKFTYSIRDTARRFCENIIDIKKTKTHEPDFFDKTPQERLKNLPWFYLSYEKDPTIRAMLTMLDAIHEKYNDSQNKPLFDNLQNITFYILPMNGFNLTDELYVKMNARGKQLTDFENFKADLIKWMKADNNPYSDIYKHETELDGRNMEYYMSFSQKMDNIWTKFFWNYSKNGETEEDKVPDRFLLNFFNRYLFNLYIVDSKALIKDDIFKYFYREEGNDSALKYRSFKEYQIIFEQKNVIGNIEKCLDCFSKHYTSIIRGIAKAPWWNEWDFFQSKLTNLSQRVIFFAITLFIEKNDVSTDFPLVQFKRWMRVVWNIVENYVVDVDSYHSALKLIHDLSAHSQNIYSGLQGFISNVAEAQIAEERQKAHSIIENKMEENKIITAEKYAFFKGAIRFLYIDGNGEPNWELFDSRFAKVQKYFDENGVTGVYKKDALLLRFLISKFSEWEHFTLIHYDNKSSTWKNLLLNNKLTNVINQFFQEENIEISELQNFESCIENEKLRFFQNDLCKSTLLYYSVSDCTFHWWNHNGQYSLYPYNTKAQWKIYVLAHNRNKILSDLIDENIIESERKIINVPYFWGWDIYFKCKRNKREYCWRIDEKLQEKDQSGNWQSLKINGDIEKLKDYLLTAD